MRRVFDCVESTEEIEFDNLTIRLWIAEDDHVEDSVYNYDGLVDAIKRMDFHGKTIKQVALSITDSFDYLLNAIQVKDNNKPTKSGIMLYCVKF